MLPYPTDHLSSPPPYAAATAPSSLSPSAAPFTVDCPRPSSADPHHRAPNPTGLDLPTAPSLYAAAGGGGDWGSASWMDPPSSYMAPVAAPPAYKGEGPASAPYGIFPGTHFGNFLDIPPLRSESSQSTSAKGPGTWLGTSEVLPSGVGTSVFSQQQNTFVHKSEDAEPYPTQRGLLQYPPQYPAYEKYMTQLSACSSDMRPPVMWTTPVNSSEVAEQMFPVMNKNAGESSSSFSSYMNPCRINLDYFDCMWNEQKDLGHQTADKHHKKWRSSATASNMATGGNHLFNSLGADHHVVRCLGNGRPVQESSEMKSDWGIFNSKVSPPEVGYVQSREFSSDMPEINNPTVDSPCWKGAPAAYPHSFGIMKNTDNPNYVKGVGGYNSSHQIEQAPGWSLKYSDLFSKQQEVSASESVKSDALKTFKLPVARKNYEDNKDVPLVTAGIYNGTGNDGSYFPEEQDTRRQKCYDSAEDFKNEAAGREENPSASKGKLLSEDSAYHIASITEESLNRRPIPLGSAPRLPVEDLSESLHVNVSSQAVGADECTVSQICTKGVQKQPHYYSDAGGNMLKTSCESSSMSPAMLLKQMHSLSVMFISTCNGGPSLQGYEEELLQSVIQNLRDASSSRSKAVAKLPEDKMLADIDVSQLTIYKNLWIEAEASACKLKYELQLTRMKLATMKNRNNTQVPVDSSKDNKAFISTISNGKRQNCDKESTAYPVNLQSLGEDSCDGQPPVVNRCIVDGADAEVTKKLKYLQSNLENRCSSRENNFKEQEEASKISCALEDAVMARLKVLNSRPDNMTSSKEENTNQQLDMSKNRPDNIDDAVMSRLRILKSRPDNITPLDQESSKEKTDESTDTADLIDNTVMSRLRILKSRPDNSTPLDQESSKQKPDESTDTTDLIDNAVMSRLRILKSRPDNLTPLYQVSSKHKPDEGTDAEDMTDNAVMSRLRILKCRNDNINALADVSKQHVEGYTDQSNWDKDGVMAKIQAPNGEVASISLGCQNILHSGNVMKHLEGKDSINLLGDTTCSDEDNGCNALSDEVNDKSAVQSDDSFAMNHCWQQTTMDTHICTAGSQENSLISSSVHKYDIFPPEWEHVLKENFFHPGK
uniref:Uncharacterized protein n=1 Tax=Leersia perrieri TaxID=77586 RepID=A0A0D9XLX4_9ORYZ